MIAFKKCFFDNWLCVLKKMMVQRKKAATKFQILLTFFNKLKCSSYPVNAFVL